MNKMMKTVSILLINIIGLISYGQTCTNGYILGQPLGLVTNGDFSSNGGTVPFATLTAFDNPAVDQGSALPGVGFYSQCRREVNNTWPDGSDTGLPTADKYNSIALQSGYTHLPSYLEVGNFQGDVSFNVPSKNTWALTNGNVFITWSPVTFDGKEYVIWGQNITGLTPNQPYTFYFYLNNALEFNTCSGCVDPYVRLRSGGTLGLPNGSLALDVGNVVRNDDATAALNGWARYSYSFTPSTSSMLLQITDNAIGFQGDDLAIAAIDLIQCIPTVTASNNITVCSGATGNISASTTSTGTFTYSWTGPNGFSATGASPSIPNMTAAKQGYYVATITDNVGITNKDSVLVSMITGPTVNAGANQTICNGASANLSASGASSYSWSHSLGTGANKTVSPTSTTNYTVTGTAANGCTDTDVVRVTVNSLPTVNAGANQTICSGDAVTLTGSGASTYTWNQSLGAGASHTFNPTVTSNYTVTGTDANGCVDTDVVRVTVNSLPTVNAGVNQTICSGDAVTLTGTGASAYSWNHSLGAGANHTFNPTVTRNYTVTGTDANGCVDSDVVRVTVNSLPNVNAGVNQSICEGEDATITATGANTYSWNRSLGAGASHTVTPTTTLSYTVTGTDANGCVDTDAVQVTVNSLPTVNAGVDQSICIGEDATITATGANTYSWNRSLGAGASHTVTPTTTLSYTVTGTDANGCVDTDAVQVTVNSLPTVNAGVDQSICIGEDATITATGSNTYSWNRGLGAGASKVITPTTSLNYTVTGTDANGCVDTDVVRVNVNSLPNVNAGANQSICIGEDATITATGANTYSWNRSLGAGASHTITPTTTLSYTVTGTDANGCINTDAVQVAVNSLPTVNAGPNQAICLGEDATISATGANTYTWNRSLGAGASHTITPTTTLSYTVTGTDVNGCVDTDAVQVTVNSLPTVNAGVDQTICFGESATITATGASTYSWDRGLGAGASHTVSPNSTLLYTVTGTDANSCENTDAVRVFVSNAFDASILMSDTSICLGDSILNIGVVDGGGEWSGIGISDINAGNFNSEISGVGTFMINYLIDNSCGDEDSVEVTVLGLPNVEINSSSNSLCEGDSVELSVAGALSYSWNNGLGTNTNYILYPTDTTEYIVTGTDGNTCSNSDTVVIDYLTLPAVSIIASDNSMCEGEEINLSVTGNDNYTWNGAINGSTFTFNGSSSQYVFVDAERNGCISSDSLYIDVYSNPTLINSSSTNEVCKGESIQLSVSGAASYNWSPISNSSSSVIVSPEVNTIYYIDGLSTNGCQGSLEIEVIVNVCDPEIFIPEGFTPNTDGTNDTFVIVGLEEYPENEIYILNRWGGIVYEQKGYENDWGAVGNGASGKVIQGTYFYILKLNDKNDNVYKGTLEITYNK